MSDHYAVLSIRQEIAFSEYSFSYTDWSQSQNQSWTAGLTSAETEQLHQSLAAFCQRPTMALFGQIQGILNQLLPEKLRTSLNQKPPASLALLSDEFCLPWEWLGSLESPLFCSCNLTRELNQRSSSSADLHQEPLFLLVADTLTKHSGSDEDTNLAWGILRDSSVKVVNATSTATRESVLDALYGDRFAVVYAACPGLGRLEINGGSVSPGEQTRTEKVGPRLVFLHNYVRPSRPDLHLYEAATQWANSLCTHGCEALITNLWSASPSDQRRITKSFFTSLCSQARLGEALRLARRELWDKGCIGAAAYSIFGNAQLRVGDLRPMRVRESTTMPGGLTSVAQLSILNGPEAGRIVPLFISALNQRSLIIGSSGARSCDIELDDSLPNQTASLTLQDNTLVLRNLTDLPNLLQVNGLPVRNEIALCGWEKIRLGTIEVQLESAGGPGDESSQSVRAFCVELHDDKEIRTEWYEDDLTLLGRGTSSKISFKDPAVSRSHALLQRSGDSLLVSRLGVNVVAVNGVPINLAQELSADDLVQLSDRAYFKVLRIVAEAGSRKQNELPSGEVSSNHKSPSKP